METSKKTFEQIVDFSNEASMILNQSTGETKLTYAIKRLIGDNKSSQKGRLLNISKEVQSIIRDLQVDYASVDDKGNLIVDSKGMYSYTKDNKKALDKAVVALDKKEFEFEPYYATEITEELTDYQKELFKGFVIKN